MACFVLGLALFWFVVMSLINRISWREEARYSVLSSRLEDYYKRQYYLSLIVVLIILTTIYFGDFECLLMTNW